MAKKKKKKSAARRAPVSYAKKGKKSAGNPKMTLGQAKRLLGIGGKKKKGKRSGKRRSGNPFAATINMSRPSKIAVAGFGVLAGVAGVKGIANALPDTIKTNTLYSFLAELAIAGGLWWVGSMVDAEFGAAVGLGGIAKAGSTGLNAWIPSIGSKIALSGHRGVGDFVKGKFAVPQNPVLDAATGLPKRVAASVRAYPSAYAIQG